ncbi:MAG: hypothetical protein WC964_02945 [Acholeplasmataceae bacterium]
MSENKSKPKAKKTNQPAKTGKIRSTSYKNPSETVWGKIILWLIIFGMAGLILSR